MINERKTCFNYSTRPMVICCDWRNVVHCSAGAPHLRYCLYTTLPVPLDCSNTYNIWNECGCIYVFIYLRMCASACVRERSPIIINIIICTNPKTMTSSACGIELGLSCYVVVCPLPPSPTNHGGRWTATTQWRPSHIIRLKKKTKQKNS